MEKGQPKHQNIATILEAEAEFTSKTPGIFEPFAPQLLDTFDVALGMYHTFGRILGDSPAFGKATADFNECAKALGAADGPDLDRIRAAGASGDPAKQKLLDDVQAAEDRFHAVTLRGVLYGQMARAFWWSVADLLRMRLTTAIGLQRIVVEGYALLCLMRDDPGVAIEWSNIHTDVQGKAFHKNHNKQIQKVLTQVGLDKMYEKASGMALHARFSGAGFGLSVEGRREYSKAILETIVGHQELRADNVFYYLVETVGILDANAGIFLNLAGAFPDAYDPYWANGRLPAFFSSLTGLWQRFRSAFPDEIAALEKKYGPLRNFGPQP